MKVQMTGSDPRLDDDELIVDRDMQIGAFAIIIQPPEDRPDLDENFVGTWLHRNSLGYIHIGGVLHGRHLGTKGIGFKVRLLRHDEPLVITRVEEVND